ncbi:MAG TPA: TonB family protein [Candidatus Angelobacter sp.]|nr:TonB family protein [Candidatus Angelobacter sp.]
MTARAQREGLLKHFALRELPFGVTPNPSFLFSSRVHCAALHSMVQSIEMNLGFTVLLGEPGMGKTTLLLQLLTQYRESARTAFLFQTQGRRFDLLRFLASELELPDTRGDEVLLHQQLREMLVNEARAGRKVLVIIDEAQNLNQTSLEAIRLLSDFETASSKLLHIILAGSARLGETLQAPDLSPLAQRIMTICRLEPFTTEEVKQYVIFRLETAGCPGPGNVFTPEALAAIAEESGGVPRLVNSICYRALSSAFATGKRRVSAGIAWQAVRDLDLSDSGRGWNTSGLGFSLPTDNQEWKEERLESRQHVHVSAPGDSPFSNRVEPTHLSTAPSSSVPSSSSFPPPPFSPPPSPPTSSTSPNKSAPASASRNEHTVAKTIRLNRNSLLGVGVPEFLALKSGGMKPDRLTIALAALVALTLLLWGGWYVLRGKAERDMTIAANIRAAHIGVAADSTADTTAVEDLRPLGQEILQPKAGKRRPSSRLSDFSLVPSPTEESNIGPAERKMPEAGGSRTSAPMIETLRQTEIPSQLGRHSAIPNEAEATVRVNPGNISKLSNQPKLPLATGQPRIPLLNPASITESAATPDTSLRRPIKVVQPEYPDMAKIRRIGGVVLLELEVDAQGNVQKVRTLSGNSLLSEAAKTAALQWQYPPSANDQTAPSVMQVRFNFSLNSERMR